MKRRILLIFGNEPNPLHMERMRVLKESGRYEPLFLYWQRGAASITLPFSSDPFPPGTFIPVHLPDPRGPKWRRAALSLVFVAKLVVAVRRLKPNIIHPINVEMLGFAVLASIGLKNIAIAYDFQDQIGDDLNRLYRTIYGKLLSRADVTFMHADSYRDFLKKNGIYDAASPMVDITTGPIEWPEERKTHNRKELVVGYYGYMRGKEQISALIHAAEKVNDAGKRVVVDFAGCGDDAEMVRNFSQKHPFVRFGGAFNYTESYKNLFFGADLIFAVYSQDIPLFRTHFARRFCEAVISGTPIIVAQGSRMGRFVTENGGGWAVGETSATEMAEVLARVHDDRSLLETQLPKEKRNLFKFETYKDGYLAALDSVVEKRSTRVPHPIS